MPSPPPFWRLGLPGRTFDQLREDLQVMKELLRFMPDLESRVRTYLEHIGAFPVSVEALQEHCELSGEALLHYWIEIHLYSEPSESHEHWEALKNEVTLPSSDLSGILEEFEARMAAHLNAHGPIRLPDNHEAALVEGRLVVTSRS